jgi:hypothetical protein
MLKFYAASLCCLSLGLCGAAGAAEGQMSSSTLAAMGLGGATVVDDSVAADVRGMGYAPSGVNGFALAAGGSIAYVGAPHAGAGSANVYAALGNNYASGNNFSEAGKTITKTHTVTIGELTTTKTSTTSLRVYAGGFSSAISF